MSDKSATPVQEKIPCIYKIGVTNEPSSKRPGQSFKVSATRDLTEKAIHDDIQSSRATEKLDGTCCMIDTFNGKPAINLNIDVYFIISICQNDSMTF